MGTKSPSGGESNDRTGELFAIVKADEKKKATRPEIRRKREARMRQAARAPNSTARLPKIEPMNQGAKLSHDSWEI